jgi:hypothetical protein|tara:strand:- start:492 stop:635 length:144 start_codon:yes stop_codon:yes gene_type:complete
MAKSVYSWGKAAKNGNKRGGAGTGPKKPSVKAPKAGVKKTKKIKTGY